MTFCDELVSSTYWLWIVCGCWWMSQVWLMHNAGGVLQYIVQCKPLSSLCPKCLVTILPTAINWLLCQPQLSQLPFGHWQEASLFASKWCWMRAFLQPLVIFFYLYLWLFRISEIFWSASLMVSCTSELSWHKSSKLFSNQFSNFLVFLFSNQENSKTHFNKAEEFYLKYHDKQ